MIKEIVIIDTESGFVEKVNYALKVQQLDQDYRLIHLAPMTIGPRETIVNDTLLKISNLIREEAVYAIFVDLSFSEEATDNLGIAVASAIKQKFTKLPVFSITNKTKNDRDYDNLSEASLENLEGCFVKTYLYGTDFSKQRFENIFTKAFAKINSKSESTILKPVQEHFDFAIITALYKDDFQEVEKLFDWDETADINTDTKKYRVGHLKNFPEKRLVAAVPSATGMVDSAIVATQMLDLFKPKFLLMSGVCGGIPSSNFGDIVLAKKIFTFQKGKVSDLRNENGGKIELYDIDKNKVDYDRLYDENRKQVKITIEKFEIEHDSMIEIDPLLADTIEPRLEGIKNSINEYLKPFSKSITIHFEAMACSTMVINREGFFEDYIKVVDRKTVAVEMESYGVARACRFANNGRTKFVIFKSVMDNLSNKDDDAKKFAAYTSAQFLKHLIYDHILK